MFIRRNTYDNLLDEIAGLRKALHEAKEEVPSLKFELLSVNSQVTALKMANEKLEDRIAEADLELKNLRKTNHDLLAELTEKEDNLKQLGYKCKKCGKYYQLTELSGTKDFTCKDCRSKKRKRVKKNDEHKD